MGNASEDEAHELVALRLPEDETRPVSELLELPEDELGELAMNEPATVLVAAPGEHAMAVVGDGTISEPGRYLFACFIPVGADPRELMQQAQPGEVEGETEGPPEVEGGPPHAAEGMYAEVVVQ